MTRLLLLVDRDSEAKPGPQLEQPSVRQYRLFSHRELILLPRLMITEHQERFLAYAARLAGTCVAPAWAWEIMCEKDFMMDQHRVFPNFVPFPRPRAGPYYGHVILEDGSIKVYDYHPLWIL
jgi:hypothetical protein